MQALLDFPFELESHVLTERLRTLQRLPKRAERFLRYVRDHESLADPDQLDARSYSALRALLDAPDGLPSLVDVVTCAVAAVTAPPGDYDLARARQRELEREYRRKAGAALVGA